ncbi:MAG: hypothetical protein Q8K45_21235 [Rubrivivax sp.]|nr:hypothetical protein [Rubrivivax sp.]
MTPIEVRATAELLEAKAAAIVRLAKQPQLDREAIAGSLLQAQEHLDALKLSFSVKG